MQALRYHSHGEPASVLQLDDIASPALSEDQVRLRILASPINPADLNIIQGNYGRHPGLPATGGLEGCGEVIESRSPHFAAGDRVMMLLPVGAWAEQAVADAGSLFRLPAGIDPLQAAMLKVNPATAWRLLTGYTVLEPGSWIIQNAANSAVGRCVIAVAKHLGIHTINLVRRPELIDELIAAGADEVFLDEDESLEKHHDAAPCLAFNAVGGESSLRLLKALSPGGIHITYGAMARRPVTVSARSLIFDDIQVRGLWITRWIEQSDSAEVGAMYEKLAALMLQGVIAVPVDSTHALTDFRSALARLTAPDRSGKVLLTP